MTELFNEWMPNVIAYLDKFSDSCAATVQMFLIAGVFTFVFGFLFGVILTTTRKDGIAPNKVLFTCVDIFTNIFSSIPFVILLIFLIPFTRTLVGTAVGVKGAIVPLVFGATPFYTRQIESALATVDEGKVEAARSMGSGTLGIIFRVYIKESVPEVIRATTITAISLIGLTTMAGAVGAGGIGSFAINYGQNLHHQDIVNVCVVLLLVCVSLIQIVGNTLAKETTNKALFTHKTK